MLLETGLGQERKEAWGLAGLEELRMERRASGSGSEEGAWGFSTHWVCGSWLGLPQRARGVGGSGRVASSFKLR